LSYVLREHGDTGNGIGRVKYLHYVRTAHPNRANVFFNFTWHHTQSQNTRGKINYLT